MVSARTSSADEGRDGNVMVRVETGALGGAADGELLAWVTLGRARRFR